MNQACHGGNQRPKSPHIDPDEQQIPLFGEAREQQGGRHIADDLADEYSCDHLVALNDLCNGVVQQSDPLQIPNKEKESHKGEQQSVVHAAQNMPVDQQYKKQDQPGGYWIRYPICNGQQTEEK